MTDAVPPTSPAESADAPARRSPVSRRTMLRGVAGGAGLAVFGGLSVPAFARAAEILGMNQPATVLETAERLQFSVDSGDSGEAGDGSDDTDDTGDTGDTGDDTESGSGGSDSDPPALERPADGKIAFPIAAASDCYVLDNFGDCRSGCSRLHEGVDIMGSRYQAVYAVADGVLTKRYDDRGLSWGAGNGWTLYDEANDVHYRFFHLDSHEPGLEEGDAVAFGQVIGYVGRTGTSGANNYHLHFEYRPGNRAVNPLPLLEVPGDQCGVSPPIRG